LRQVFTSLMDNAIRSTPLSGHIHVRSWNSERSLTIEVEDTGLALTLEPALLQFRPHVHLDGKPVAGVLGVGLAIVKGLVEVQGGKLEALSRGSKYGTRVIVDLPSPTALLLDAPAPELLPSRAPEPQPLPRLLLLEDHEGTAEVLEELLHWSGFEILVADPMTAMARQDVRIELVITGRGILPHAKDPPSSVKGQPRRPRTANVLPRRETKGGVQELQKGSFDLELTQPVTPAHLLNAAHMLRRVLNPGLVWDRDTRN
jgi:hypothetical protein